MKSSKGASPLQLGPGSPVFAGPFKKNLSALFRMNGEKVKFTQMKHAWAHMVQVKYRSADGRETNLKLHFYTEVLAPEYDNIVCDECRIMGTQTCSRSRHACLAGICRIAQVSLTRNTIIVQRFHMSDLSCRSDLHT